MGGSGGGKAKEGTLGNAGAGGGAIEISATGTITFAGKIYSNGGNGHFTTGDGYAGGGGSGGSIRLSAVTTVLSSGSVLQANGGNGAQNAGGGSGGRIAVLGNLTNNGATIATTGGTQNGNTGTAHYKVADINPKFELKANGTISAIFQGIDGGAGVDIKNKDGTTTMSLDNSSGIKVYSGLDLIAYSDTGSTQKALLDGATGDMSLSGAVVVGGG